MVKKNILLVLLMVLYLCISIPYVIAFDNKDMEKAQLRNSDVDFQNNPVDYMASIYRDYHDWRIDEGLKKSDAAIGIVDKIYIKDPEKEFSDPKLKLKKASQVRSTLYTLLGMLKYRKFLTTGHKAREEAYSPLMEKIKKGEELSEDDLESIAGEIEGRETDIQVKSLFRETVTAFETAVKSDPSNPAPHYQLGTVYNAATDSDYSMIAEKEFYISYKLSLKEGDTQAAERSLEALRNVNEKSEYLKRIEVGK